MPEAVDVDPFLGGFLGVANHAANFRIENLRAATRQRAEPGLAQGGKRFRHAPLAHPRQVQDLNRRKCFQVQLRIECLQRTQHVDVVVSFERWMQSANNVNLRDAELERFLRLLEHLWKVVFISARIAPTPIKRAKIAVEYANVGVIDVAVENVIGNVAILALAHEIRHRANGGQILRPIEAETVILIDALGRLNLLVDVPQLRTLNQLVHCKATSTTTAPRKTAIMTAFMRKNATFRLIGSRFFANRCCTTRQTRMIPDRKSTRLNSSHLGISYAVF